MANQSHRVAYFKGRDGWQVVLRAGAKIVQRESAASKEAAIASTKLLLNEYPGATFELCLLGKCFAWETPEGWVYSRKPDHPSAERVQVLDQLGTLVLQRSGAGYTEFIDGAKPSAASAEASASSE